MGSRTIFSRGRGGGDVSPPPPPASCGGVTRGLNRRRHCWVISATTLIFLEKSDYFSVVMHRIFAKLFFLRERLFGVPRSLPQHYRRNFCSAWTWCFDIQITLSWNTCVALHRVVCVRTEHVHCSLVRTNKAFARPISLCACLYDGLVSNRGRRLLLECKLSAS